MRRREFLPVLSVGGPLLLANPSTLLSGVTGPPQAPARASGSRIKLSSASWNFHSLAPGAHPEEAIDIIGSLGFDGVELIANSRRDIDDYWNDATIDRIRKQLDRNKLEVPQFPCFQPVVEGLTSRDGDQRKKSLDYFEAGCRIAKKLNAPMVNIVAPWARELSVPGVDYLPRYFMADPKPGEKFHIDIASGYEYTELWPLFTQTMSACLERAKAHGLWFSIENHTHTMLPASDSFLRLWDGIRDPALSSNLDCGWAMNQREYPPMAIHKLGGHLMNLHLRDVDARMRDYVEVGEGVMDFKAIADALKAIGFSGFLSLEQDGFNGDMKEACRRYISTMKECLA